MVTREYDHHNLSKMSKSRLYDFILLHLRNLWAVDGLYYLNIEKEHGMKEATIIDSRVWASMGKIEARRLKDFFNIKKNDIPTVMDILQYTGWFLDMEDKEITIQDDRGVIQNNNCRVQKTRIRKGLNEFPCKQVRLGFLEAFVREFNQDIKVECELCPPDEHPEDIWCRWCFYVDK
ncbi:MAG: DUF6125 family protein [Candidatus Thermoplasmatota archaeon]